MSKRVAAVLVALVIAAASAGVAYMATRTDGGPAVAQFENDNRPKSVIDSGTVNRGSFGQLTIESSDRFVKFLGDCTWAKM